MAHCPVEFRLFTYIDGFIVTVRFVEVCCLDVEVSDDPFAMCCYGEQRTYSGLLCHVRRSGGWVVVQVGLHSITSDRTASFAVEV